MESGAVGIDTSTAPDPIVQSDCNVACLRRLAWAQSRDSIWQEPQPEPEQCGPQGPQQNQTDGEAQRPAEEPGRVPNKITSWLIECRTPLGASLDDRSASPSKGVLRNGCSFEDDLSLGAEANHLQSANNKTESCFGLAADQKRSQYKERGRSMNSTGSGKSSTVSSVSEVLKQSEEHPDKSLLTLRVSELLDLYEEDPEEILFNLGFGREEPDLNSKVPARFFNSSSTARGIDIKVYLGAQLQRMELENPNYALTSRFRQIEVLTNVANEFFQLYSQVSGQPVQRISNKEQGVEGGEGGEGGKEGESGGEEPSPIKRTNSVRNVAKLLKKTITRHNLSAAASASPEAHTPKQQTPKQHTPLTGHAPADQPHTNGHAHAGPEQDDCNTDPNHQAEAVNQKHNRKKDSCSLATVTEESNGDGEMDDSPEQSSTGPAVNGEHQPESADSQTTNQITEEGTQVVKGEKNITSTPEKAPPILAPPKLAQLRTENADSFDMEEIQSNEDEALPPRTFRTSDLLRTVSQQSDSSGFAEEPSADSNSHLEVQESSDSCDSETTVTSHPSLDVATPIALDHPVFDLPDCREQEAGPGDADESDARNSSMGENKHDGHSEQVLQYTAHQLPRNRQMQQDEVKEEEQVENGDQNDPKSEPELVVTQSMSAAAEEPKPELEHTQDQLDSEQELQQAQNQTETAAETEAPSEGEGAEDQDEHAFIDSCSLGPPTLSSPVLRALNRAKQNQLSRAVLRIDPQSSETPQISRRGRGRGIPLQRSSSLPSSLLSPSRIVSSVRIQFGRGQSSCTQPSYSIKYTQKAAEDKEEEEDKGQTNCLSTLIINPASSSDSNNQPPRLPKEDPIPPKPIPRYLMQSSYSPQSSSPPSNWSPGIHGHSWSTQSVPDLSFNPQQPDQFTQNMSAKQNQQSWNPGQMMFPYPNPTSQYLNPSPNPSHSLNPNPNPYPFTPPPQNPSPQNPYVSLPNLLHYQSPSLAHHSSLTSLHQPTTPPIPQQGSLSNFHQPLTSMASHHVSLGSLHPGTPVMHQGYSHLYNHQSPYHAPPHCSQLASPYLGYHGYYMNPHLAFPHLPPPLPPEHSLHPGLAPPTPGFLPGPASALAPGQSLPMGLAPHAPGSLPGLASTIGPGQSLHPGLAPPASSSTEMQLRRVLHDIRGTVQSLNQNRADTPDMFNEHRAILPCHQSLAEFQQKRKSLNLFRSQMMELELSIIRQQALVYKHLSPADRLEMEQLHSLRSAVREELQELEQQLEDRLLELTHHTQHRGLHRDSSVDSLSTASLKAMEPVSDLLREQLLLQSELSYDSHAPSPNDSSRSSSPVREVGDRDGGRGVYRASINITPVLAPRPNTNTTEVEELKATEGENNGRGEGRVEVPEKEKAADGVGVDNLQQLIREIRESVAQQVRQEIYNELLATVSPRRSPTSAQQHPL